MVALALDEQLEFTSAGLVLTGGKQEPGAGGVREPGDVHGGDLAPAQRAAGVALEPAIDTVDVERVLALRQQAEDLIAVEFGYADGAFEAVADAAERREAEEGDRLNDGPVDA